MNLISILDRRPINAMLEMLADEDKEIFACLSAAADLGTLEPPKEPEVIEPYIWSFPFDRWDFI